MYTLVPRSYFDEHFHSKAAAAAVNGVSTLLRIIAPKVVPSAAPQFRDVVSVFDVLALMLQDKSLASASTDTPVTESLLASILKTKGDVIRK